MFIISKYEKETFKILTLIVSSIGPKDIINTCTVTLSGGSPRRNCVSKI